MGKWDEFETGAETSTADPIGEKYGAFEARTDESVPANPVYLEDLGRSVEVPGHLSPRATQDHLETTVYAQEGTRALGTLQKAQQAGWNVFKGAMGYFGQLPGSFGAHLEAEGAPDVPDPTVLAPLKAKLAQPFQFLTEAQIAGLRRVQQVTKGNGLMEAVTTGLLLQHHIPERKEAMTAAGKRLREANAKYLETHKMEADPGLTNEFAFQLGSGGASMLSALGLGYLTRNPAMAATLFGIQQRGAIFREATEAGAKIETAKATADLAGFTEAALEGLGLEVFMNTVRGARPFLRIALRTGEEVLQEEAQTLGEEAIAKIGFNRPGTLRELADKVAMTAAVTVLLGGSAGTAVTLLENQGVLGDLRRAGMTDPEAQEFLTKVMDKQIAATAEPLQTALDTHIDELQAEAMPQPAEQPVQMAQEQAAPTEAQQPPAQEPIVPTKPTISEVVGGQLRAAGFTEEQVGAYSSLYERTFQTLGERTGVDPAELFRRYGLQIARRTAPVGEGMAQGKTPSAPVFFSQLERTLDQKMPTSASPEQVRGIVKDLKQEELAWVGLDEFLKGKEKVSKAELLEFVRANNVQVTEVEKVQGSYVEQEQRIADAEQQIDGIRIWFQRNGYQIESDEGGMPGEIIVTQGGDVVDELPDDLARQASKFADLQRKLDELESGKMIRDKTKFSAYQLPGGTNYRELLLTMPPKEAPTFYDWLKRKGLDQSEISSEEWQRQRDIFEREPDNFRSPHFDELNVLAHVRFNDRVDAQGKKVLFIEELQSDWHQKGRREGYAGESERIVQKWLDERPGSDKTIKARDVKPVDIERWGAPPEVLAAYNKLLQQHSAVPNAPFKKSWHELALKRMIRYAAEQGYDWIGWTTGEQQTQRYDLSKQIQYVNSMQTAGGYQIEARDKSGSPVVDEVYTEQQLPDVVGKELAEKIIALGGQPGHFEGLDLQVGGEGMRGFYDNILVSAANKLAKRFGGKVGTAQIEKPYQDAGGFVHKDLPMQKETVHALPLTPDLKQAAISQGFPLFQGEPGDPRGMIRFGGNRQFNIDLLKDADLSTFLHETGHFYLEVLGDLAATEGAPAQIVDDYATIRDWLGVKPGEAISRAHHEQFARGFEAYLREGKAPSVGLRAAFIRFREWLLAVYQDIKQLGVELSDDVRGALDRMLATDAEIEEADPDIVVPMKETSKLSGKTPKPGQRIDTPQQAIRKMVELRYPSGMKDFLKAVDAYEQTFGTGSFDQLGPEAQMALVQKHPAFTPIKQLIREKTGQDTPEKQVKESIALREVLRGQARAALLAQRATTEHLQAIKQEISRTVTEALPPAERGRFLSAVANAKTNTDIARAVMRVEAHAAELHRKSLIKALRRQLQRVEASKSIAIDYVLRIQELINSVDLTKRTTTTTLRLKELQDFLSRRRAMGEDVSLPQAVTDRLETILKTPLERVQTAELESLLIDVIGLAEMGKAKLRARQELDRLRKERDLDLLKKSTKPLERKVIIEPLPGQRFEPAIRRAQVPSRLQVAAQHIDASITPMDAHFDALDGAAGYTGPNFRIFKAAIDAAYGRYLDMKDQVSNALVELGDKLKLDDTNYERIGVVAARSQEGGLKKLLASGLDETQINAISLTADEQAWYRASRAALDALRPRIEEVMRVVYNEPLGEVKNYFPFLTDFEAMSDFEIRQRFGESVPQYGAKPSKNVERGFTKKRVGGAQQIRLNARDVFLKHVDDATYLVHVGAQTKYLGELANSPEYRDIAGDLGQELVVEWVDTVARKGRLAGEHPRWLDVIRRNVGLASLAFKLSSAMIQPSALADGAALVGPQVFEGARQVAISPEWRAFVKTHMPELRERIGDDPAYTDFGAGLQGQVAEKGLWAVKKLDALTATSVAIGAYQKFMDSRGRPVDFANPDPDAIAWAQLMVRRSQASALAKDLPPALSRGKLTGDKSLDRALFQFQTFLLNKWSVLRHDLARAGIRPENQAQGVNIAAWLTLSLVAEIGLRDASDALVDLLLQTMGFEPKEPKDEDSFTEKLAENALQMIPFVGQAMSAFSYGSIPVPALDTFKRAADRVQAFDRSKRPATKIRNGARAALAIAGLFGVPVAQVDQLIRRVAP